MKPVVPHSPEHSRQLTELETLKAEYVKQWNNRNVLLEWGKPQLEALYYAKIGKHQIELLTLKKEVFALKRKLEMIQAYINRAEPINLPVIELLVELEVKEQEEKIAREAEKLEAANHLLANLASPERSVELRKTFRHIAKRLHPDINPNLPDEARKLWDAAVHAYEYGDLESLKAFALLADDYHTQPPIDDELFITTQIQLLKEGIKKFIEEIAQIRSGFPFTLEHQLRDEAWVSEQLSAIGLEIALLNAQKSAYEEKISQILQNYDHV
ncbi:MAG: hypothetical protein NZM35_09850 [Chitinophagales bacterium]|nr:hypothetical protein [Chitinophagales bacterium]MDW8419583.1 hypothetical protein [Chitinophagales bacterium]